MDEQERDRRLNELEPLHKFIAEEETKFKQAEREGTLKGDKLASAYATDNAWRANVRRREEKIVDEWRESQGIEKEEQ